MSPPKHWPDTFDEWTVRAHPVVYASVYKKLRSRYMLHEDAKKTATDAVSTAIAKAGQKKGSDHFPKFLDFLKWTHVVARREAFQILKKEKKKWISLESSTAEAIIEGPGPADSGDELKAALRECIEQLDPTQRRIIEWRFEEGLIFKEIADLIGVGLTMSFNRTRETLARLRRCMNSKDYY